MDLSLSELLARSMDAEPELLPYLPELFADLEELGAQVDDVLATLRPLPLSANSTTHMLDLGCGKGAVALSVAKQLGWSVHGVDGLPAFVDHANQRANAEGLSNHCRFTIADVRDLVTAPAPPLPDVVAMLALGPLLGDTAETIGTLRNCVPPGGYILLDDCYLDPTRLAESPQLPDTYDSLQDLETTRAMLTSHGDQIVCERIIDEPEQRPRYEAMTAAIQSRAAALATGNPDLADVLLDFASRQEEEVELLCGPIVGAVWLLQRGTPGR